MTITASACDLMDAYEALRAQVMGERPEVTPRGKAILVSAGLAAWMAALPPPEERSSMTMPAGRAGEDDLRTTHHGEIVCLLAEMVLFAAAGWGS